MGNFDWLNVNPTSGSGNKLVTNRADRHTGRAERTQTLTIKTNSGNKTATYLVKQSGAALSFVLNGTTFTESSQAHTAYITGTSNAKKIKIEANGTLTGNVRYLEFPLFNEGTKQFYSHSMTPVYACAHNDDPATYYARLWPYNNPQGTGAEDWSHCRIAVWTGADGPDHTAPEYWLGVTAGTYDSEAQDLYPTSVTDPEEIVVRSAGTIIKNDFVIDLGTEDDPILVTAYNNQDILGDPGADNAYKFSIPFVLPANLLMSSVVWNVRFTPYDDDGAGTATNVQITQTSGDETLWVSNTTIEFTAEGGTIGNTVFSNTSWYFVTD